LPIPRTRIGQLFRRSPPRIAHYATVPPPAQFRLLPDSGLLHSEAAIFTVADGDAEAPADHGFEFCARVSMSRERACSAALACSARWDLQLGGSRAAPEVSTAGPFRPFSSSGFIPAAHMVVACAIWRMAEVMSRKRREIVCDHESHAEEQQQQRRYIDERRARHRHHLPKNIVAINSGADIRPNPHAPDEGRLWPDAVSPGFGQRYCANPAHSSWPRPAGSGMAERHCHP